MVKRTVDIVLSSALLLLAAPILLLAALGILFTSPGPVLFRQTRMGRGFQPFEILKLRTMAHAEAGLAYTLGPDPRITPIGNLLRRTKLDELPQLWNVLRGQMSLVGPRPVLPELTFEFYDEYRDLLRARPGLTDPASLKYSQETHLLAQAHDPMHFFKTVVTPDKLRISRDYMRRANLFTDAQTLLMTAVVCCFPPASRLYGQLPSIPNPHTGAVAAPERKTSVVVDGSIFAHERALREAALEESSRSGVSPWIHLPTPDFASRSASMPAKRRATRL